MEKGLNYPKVEYNFLGWKCLLAGRGMINPPGWCYVSMCMSVHSQRRHRWNDVQGMLRGTGSCKPIWPRALLLSLSSLQVGIAWPCGSSVPCSLGSGLEGSSEAPGGLQASFAYSLITDFTPMKWISPVDCSASYLNGCFRLLIYLFNPSVTLLPTESLKSLSYTLQESEFFVLFLIPLWR